MRVSSLDHLVLTVRSISDTIDFYARAFGMTAITFAGGRRALSYGDQKINLHEVGHEFEPKAAHPTPGSADLCFLTDSDMSGIVNHLTREGIVIVEGPVPRTGALGPIMSVYLRDPDQNLIELATMNANVDPRV